MNTQAVTIATFIGDLIDTHIEKCDGDRIRGNPIPHVVNPIYENSAMIEKIKISKIDHTLHMALSDGTKFTVTIQKVSDD